MRDNDDVTARECLDAIGRSASATVVNLEKFVAELRSLKVVMDAEYARSLQKLSAPITDLDEFEPL